MTELSASSSSPSAPALTFTPTLPGFNPTLPTQTAPPSAAPPAEAPLTPIGQPVFPARPAMQPAASAGSTASAPIGTGLKGTLVRGCVMIATYLAVTVLVVDEALHMARGYRFVERLSRQRVASASDISTAEAFDERTMRLIVVAIPLVLVAALATAVWSRAVAKNTRALGNRNISVGKATFGWFIPIGEYWVGFRQVKKAPGGDTAGPWQFWWVAPLIGTAIANLVLNMKYGRAYGTTTDETVEAVLASLRRQLIISLVLTFSYVLATALAARAMLNIRRGFRDVEATRRAQAAALG